MIPKANKCYTVPLCLGIFVCFILVSCTDAKTSTFDNTLPVDKVEVLINYGGFETNKATTYLANELDISQRTLFSKEDNAKIVSSLIGGDIVELYYSGNDIDHVLVDEASLLVLSSSYVPGEESVQQIFSEETGITIDSTNISYVVNQDRSYASISEVPSGTELWGVYQEDDITYTSKYNAIYPIRALYSFKPR